MRKKSINKPASIRAEGQEMPEDNSVTDRLQGFRDIP